MAIKIKKVKINLTITKGDRIMSKKKKMPESLRIKEIGGKIISVQDMYLAGYKDVYEFKTDFPYSMEAEILNFMEAKAGRSKLAYGDLKYVCSENDIFFGPVDNWGRGHTAISIYHNIAYSLCIGGGYYNQEKNIFYGTSSGVGEMDKKKLRRIISQYPHLADATID